MKLTKKKRIVAASAAIRDIHILSQSIKHYKSLFDSFKPEIREIIGPDAVTSVQTIFAKSSHIDNVLTEIYKSNQSASVYLSDTNGLTHIEEIAAQVIDAMNQIQKQYKPNENTTN